jgi:hypothetical protein
MAIRGASTRVGALLALTMAAPCVTVGMPRDAAADTPTFSPFDVPTAFYISKSDDHNRVDYGIHLDANCAPAKNDAVFLYWREFENSPPVRIHALGMFEYIPYGIAEQRTTQKSAAGGTQFVRLRQFGTKPIEITTARGTDGRCTAKALTTIGGKECELSFVYVKLASGFLTPNVEFVDVHGRDLATGKEVVERLRR